MAFVFLCLVNVTLTAKSAIYTLQLTSCAGAIYYIAVGLEKIYQTEKREQTENREQRNQLQRPL